MINISDYILISDIVIVIEFTLVVSRIITTLIYVTYLTNSFPFLLFEIRVRTVGRFILSFTNSTIFRSKSMSNTLLNENCESRGKNKQNQHTGGYNFKDEDIFVIEDESQVTMEDNNQPVKVNPMEIDKYKDCKQLNILISHSINVLICIVIS